MTSPAYKWRELAPQIPTDLRGWRALDIGCNAGFYAIEMARRGADIVGIACNDHYLRQARWAAHRFGLADRLEFHHQNARTLRFRLRVASPALTPHRVRGVRGGVACSAPGG